jgi:outer membrane protein assembly factor BamB
VRAEKVRVKADRRNPARNEPSILPGGQATAVITNDIAYIGGLIVAGHDNGDVVATGAGMVYLLDLRSGKVLGTANVDGPVRAGLVADDTDVFITTEAGSVFKATTFGSFTLRRIVTLQYPDEFGEDTSGRPASLAKYDALGNGKYSVPSIYAAPAVTQDKLFVGFVRQTYYKYPAVVAINRLQSADPYLWVGTDPDKQVDGYGNVRFTPAIYKNLLILGDPYSNAYALHTEDGTLAWRTPLGQSMFQHWPAPVVAGQNVFVARHDGYVHMLDPAIGRRLWSIFLGDEGSAGLVFGARENFSTNTLPRCGTRHGTRLSSPPPPTPTDYWPSRRRTVFSMYSTRTATRVLRLRLGDARCAAERVR